MVVEHTFDSNCEASCLPGFFNGLEEKLSNPMLQRALELLRQDPRAYVSVEEWAMDVGVSREHLTRTLAPTINPHALLQAARVILALSELSDQKSLHAGSALESMGYNSRAHAFAVFKKTTGMTPTEYWNQARDESVHASCVLHRCPLLGATLDRYRRHYSNGATKGAQPKKKTVSPPVAPAG